MYWLYPFRKDYVCQRVSQKNQKTVLIDGDEIATFTREKYPLIVNSLHNKTRKDFKNPNLKLIIFKDVYKFYLDIGLNIILSNGNLAKKSRAFAANNAHRQGYTLVTVYFNLPNEVILKRLQKTTKSKKVFIHSKTWNEVFTWQKEYANLPPSKKNTTYFEIKNNADQEAVIKEISKLI